MLTPNYGVCCKRRIFDETWFQGLNDSRIELTTQPLMSVQAHSITVGPGRCYPDKGPDVVLDQREIPADVIVIANGFETTHYLHPLKIKGRGGRDMVEEMEARGGPQAYHGMAMDNFPNCFLIFGPNTAQGHTSVILASENMIEYSLKFIEPILKGDISTVEVKREAEEAYTAEIQRANKGLVFNSGGCHSWYVHGDWNGTTYPYSQFWFWMMCLFPRWSDWDIRYVSGLSLKVDSCYLLMPGTDSKGAIQKTDDSSDAVDGGRYGGFKRAPSAAVWLGTEVLHSASAMGLSKRHCSEQISIEANLVKTQLFCGLLNW